MSRPGRADTTDDPDRLRVLQVVLNAVLRQADALGKRCPGQSGLGSETIHDPVAGGFPVGFWVVFWVASGGGEGFP